MMGKDEAHSLKLLAEHDHIIVPIIKKHSGKIIKHIGDSIFAQFVNTDEALHAAIEFQTQLRERNQLASRNDHIQVRAGIHVGTVIEKDGDLFGNDVNITSRIEGVASVEGIALSQSAMESIDATDKLYFRKIGHVKLKNIQNPQLLYKAYLNHKDWQNEPDELLLQTSIRRGINIVDIEEYQILHTFSLAVMDVHCESTNEEDQLYCDLLTEDITSDFQSINDIRVPIRKEIQKYSVNGYVLSDIAHKLQVNAVLESKIELVDDEINFSVKLFSTISGEYVWDSAWVCKRENTNFLRLKLLQELADYYNIALSPTLLNSFSREMTGNSIALKKYSEGRAMMEKLHGKDDLNRAHKLLSEAIELDDEFVEARAQYAFSCLRLGYYDECEEVLEEALEIAVDDDYEKGMIHVYNYFGTLYGRQHKLKKARKSLEKALNLLKAFNDHSWESRLLYNLANVKYLGGEPHEAITCLDRSKELKIELEENDSLVLVYNTYSYIYTLLNDFSNAIDYRERASTQLMEQGAHLNACKVLVALAGSYEKVGEFDAAVKVLANAESFEAEAFERGKILLIQGRIAIEKEDYTTAKTVLKQAEEQYMQMGDNRLLINTYLTFSLMYIRMDDYKKATSYSNLASEQGKKLRGVDISYLTECMSMWTNPQINESDISSVEEKITEFNTAPAYYAHWYYLSQAYLKFENKSKSDECISISRILLKESAACNSDRTHEKSMLNNIWLHREILG